MKVLLVRHGETVDNVAGVYAGVRDSALTNHGILQAERLGKFLSDQSLTHVHASDLSRALKTAEIVLAAQATSDTAVEQFTDLREQDFGFYEGKPFYARQQQSSLKKSADIGRDQHRQEHVHEADFEDVESKASLDGRAQKYLDQAFLPLLRENADSGYLVIVSHGILLSHLWRRMILLFDRKKILLGSTAAVDTSTVVLEHLGGWGNTGFLELDIKVTQPGPGLPFTASACEVVIRTINGKQHLQGLKRTRGVGSARHDSGQRKVDSFFKRKRVDE